MKIKSILIGALLLGSFLFLDCSKATNNQDAILLSLINPNPENPSSTSNTSSFVPVNVRLFDKVTEAPGSGSGPFSDPQKAINGVFGFGKTRGSTDVYSLKSSPTATYCKPNEKCIVLEVENKKIKNGSGIDFVVFENPFCLGGIANCGISHFMEPVIVEVSIDGINWCGFNPQYVGDNTNASLNNPNNWQRFAGKEPVVFNQSNWRYSEEDIFDPTIAGGDGFDLEDPNFGSRSDDGCTSVIKNQILSDGFIYLRLTTAFSRGFPVTPGSYDQTADIDGVIARYVTDR